MGKYVIHQHTQSGQIMTSVGDGQHITIIQTTVTRGKDAKETQPPVVPGQLECDDETGEATMIAPIGGKSQVYVNGKRIL